MRYRVLVRLRSLPVQRVTVVYIVLAALAIGGGWYVRLRLFPWKPCPACGGERRIYGAGGHRDCKRCKTTGRVRRWGAPREGR